MSTILADLFNRWRSPVAAPKAAPPATEPPTARTWSFWGCPLRYLIGAGGTVGGPAGEVVLAPFNGSVIGACFKAGYCNLLDEKFDAESGTGKYGPYIVGSDTATTWGEGQIDPRGRGWLPNINDQAKKRVRQGLLVWEWDNPDSHETAQVIEAYNISLRDYHAQVFVKNPLECKQPETVSQHPANAGFIVEADCGTPATMEQLRRSLGLMRMPVWFVTDQKGKKWAEECAATIRAKNYKGMGVTVSTKSGKNQYNDSVDVQRPIV